MSVVRLLLLLDIVGHVGRCRTFDQNIANIIDIGSFFPRLSYAHFDICFSHSTLSILHSAVKAGLITVI